MAGLMRRHLPQGSRLLEIGLGEGYLIEQMTKSGYNLSGLDVSPYIIEHIKKRQADRDRKMDLCVGSVDAVPFPDGRFDAVGIFDTLEHVGGLVLEKGLTEIKRVLRPGGLFFGTLPIDENLAEGIAICPKCGHQFHRIGHFHSFTCTSARETISRHFTLQEFKEISYRCYRPIVRMGFWGIKAMRSFMPEETPSVLKMYTAYFVATH